MANLIGKTLGPYRIIEQIGLGGMATVYKAYQPSMERYVALKVLSTHLSQTPTFVKRFQQEARVIAKLEHLHILPVYDHGEEEGYLYLVMRFIEAGTLKDRLAQGGLSLAETRRVVNQVGSALAYAHQLGVIHRDVKPSNILIDPQGDCYLTDFGIAKMVESSLNLTGSNVIGTPQYMAPEQGETVKVDERADVYAMGVVIYEMVTGRLPFDAETPFAVVMKHLTEPLPLPRSLRPDLPEEVERVILKALAKNPADRYQSMADLVAAFDRAVQAAPSDIVQATPDGIGPATPAPPVAAAGEPPSSGWRRWLAAQPPWLLGAAVLGLIVLVTAGLILSQVPGQVEISGGQVQVILPTDTVTPTPAATATSASTATPLAQIIPPTATLSPTFTLTPMPTPTLLPTPTPPLTGEGRVFTTPPDFQQAIAALSAPIEIDFQDIDAGLVNDTYQDRDPFDGDRYAGQGIIFTSPNNLPLYIAPGGLTWNESNSLSVKAFPYDSIYGPTNRPPIDDDLLITFKPPVAAVGFTLIDLYKLNDEVKLPDSPGYVQFLDAGGQEVQRVNLPVDYEPSRAFVGIISDDDLPIQTVKVQVDGNYGDVNYDDFIFVPVEQPPALGASAEQARILAEQADEASSGNNWAEALTAISQAIELDPANPQYYLRRAFIYDAGLGQMSEAVTDATTAIELAPSLYDAWETRGTVYMHGNQCQQALVDIDQAVALDPERFDGYVDRADVLRCLGRFDEAIADYGRGLAIDPSSSWAYWTRGMLYEQHGDLAAALADYEQAITLQPDDPWTSTDFYNSRAGVYRALNQHQPALADCRAILELMPNDPRGFYCRALSELALGEEAQARADLEQSVTLRPVSAWSAWVTEAAQAELDKLP